VDHSFDRLDAGAAVEPVGLVLGGEPPVYIVIAWDEEHAFGRDHGPERLADFEEELGGFSELVREGLSLAAAIVAEG
jgi:spore coat protein CotH